MTAPLKNCSGGAIAKTIRTLILTLDGFDGLMQRSCLMLYVVFAG